MKTQIQLLTADELEDDKSYRVVFADNAGCGRPHTGAYLKECRKTMDQYMGFIPADAIEFIPPDPDKALIEEWVKHQKFDTAGFVIIPRNGGNVRTTGREVQAVLRSFLDYQRKEGKR